jgi:hypothetical protein
VCTGCIASILDIIGEAGDILRPRWLLGQTPVNNANNWNKVLTSSINLWRNWEGGDWINAIVGFSIGI